MCVCIYKKTPIKTGKRNKNDVSHIKNSNYFKYKQFKCTNQKL